MVKELLNFDANLNIPCNDGRRRIFQAASSGHVEIVRFLIPSTNNPNAANNNGATPIHWAARNGHTEIVQLLIPSIDNPNAANNNGTTPIHWAARYGHNDDFQYAAEILITKSELEYKNKLVFTLQVVYWQFVLVIYNSK